MLLAPKLGHLSLYFSCDPEPIEERMIGQLQMTYPRLRSLALTCNSNEDSARVLEKTF